MMMGVVCGRCCRVGKEQEHKKKSTDLSACVAFVHYQASRGTDSPLYWAVLADNTYSYHIDRLSSEFVAERC